MKTAMRLVALAAATGAAVFTIYTPYLAPVLYGCKRWSAARPETDFDKLG